MGEFIETVFDFADNDGTIVDFANFCYLLHIKVGCEGQGCNLNQMAKKITDYLKKSNSLDSRKFLFIEHYFNNKDIMQSLLFLHKNQDTCFELTNALKINQ